jgi:hypothetical protein
MKTFDPQDQPEATAQKVRRVQKIILLVMALLMMLPGLLAWYMGVIRF